ERSALKALLRGFDRVPDYSEEPALPPDQVTGLSELRCRAVGAVEDRLRFLEEQLWAHGSEAPPVEATARHSEDFRSIHWYGTDYQLGVTARPLIGNRLTS